MELNKAIEILETVAGDKVKAYRAAKKNAKKIVSDINYYEEKHKGHYPTPYRGQLEVQLDNAKKDLRSTKTCEALSILEEMLDVANSIFERSLSEANPEAPTAEEIPPSTNKIKQTKKDKDTDKKTEVVSVADELFPYEGNAKQQMNQKILAKINDMIEGTATLEDLLQLVRKSTKKPVAVKECWDKAEVVLEEIINEISDKKKQGAKDLANHLEYIAHKEAKDYSLNKGKVYGPTGEREEKLWHLFGKAYERRDKLEKAIKKHDKAKEEGKIKPANGKEYQN